MKYETTSNLFQLDFKMVILPGSFALVVLIVTWIHLHYKKKFNYWTEKGVPGPKGRIFFGNMFEIMKNGFFLTTQNYRQKYGKIYGFYLSNTPCLVVSDPELVKDILIRNFNKFSERPLLVNIPLEAESLINQNGSQWKHDRSIISPTFTSGKMKLMFPLMKQSLNLLENEFDKLAFQQSDIETRDLFGKLIITVISKCAFATDIDAFNEKNNVLANKLKLVFHPNFFGLLRLAFVVLAPQFLKDKFGASHIPVSTLNYLDKICREILKQRRQNPLAGNEYPDFLQLLLDSNKENRKNDSSEHEGFSDTKISANAILFFLAGYDTTSTLLFWLTYVLVTYPEIQEKLHQEVKMAKDASGELDYDTLLSIKYLEAVIYETLRLYPPFPGFTRLCIEDHTLPNGMTIGKGCMVLADGYSMQNSDEYYPEAKKFNPERFMPENKDQIDPCTYLPFALGPRNCIGMRFALLEVKMALANLVLKFKFIKSPNAPDSFVFDKKSFILLPKEKIPVRVTKR